MIWLLAALALAAFAALAVIGWLGTETLYHPPKRLPLEIFPEQFGFPYEKVDFQAQDGVRLRGWFIPAAVKTDLSLLLCHGWGDNKGDLLKRTDFLRAEFNLFYFDFRYHGDSEGTRTSLCACECWDAAAALDCLRQKKPEWTRRLGLFGYSMGSAPGTWLAAENRDIKALVIESPFASFNGVLYQWAHNAYHFTYFPFVWTILQVSKLRLGMDAEPQSPIHQIGRIHPRPVFIISGENDDLMLAPTVRKVFEKAQEPKQLWMIPGAGHGKCREVAGADYERRIVEFFEKHL